VDAVDALIAVSEVSASDQISQILGPLNHMDRSKIRLKIYRLHAQFWVVPV
jgi:hypothetical protein